jgi:hypothetical protein
MPRPWSCRQKKALGQQIEPRSPEHLALEPLQAGALPCDRSLTPGPRDSCLHGGVILTPSFGNAPKGGESARGGARQPWIALDRLALADEASAVLCQRHRLRQLGRLLSKLRQVAVILLRRSF